MRSMQSLSAGDEGKEWQNRHLRSPTTPRELPKSLKRFDSRGRLRCLPARTTNEAATLRPFTRLDSKIPDA